MTFEPYHPHKPLQALTILAQASLAALTIRARTTLAANKPSARRCSRYVPVPPVSGLASDSLHPQTCPSCGHTNRHNPHHAGELRVQVQNRF